MTEDTWHRFMCAADTPRRLDNALADNARIDYERELNGGCGRRQANPRRLNSEPADSRAAAVPVPSGRECPVCGRIAWLDRTRTDGIRVFMCSNGHEHIPLGHQPIADATGEP